MKRREESSDASPAAELEQAAIAFADARRYPCADPRGADLNAALVVNATDNLHNAANRYGLLVDADAEFVLDGFDRMCASPALRENPNLLGLYVTEVLDLQDPERFDDWRWEPGRLRPLLASWLRFSPECEVKEATKRATRELEWIERFEAQCVEDEKKRQRWLSMTPAARREALRATVKTPIGSLPSVKSFSSRA